MIATDDCCNDYDAADDPSMRRNNCASANRSRMPTDSLAPDDSIPRCCISSDNCHFDNLRNRHAKKAHDGVTTSRRKSLYTVYDFNTHFFRLFAKQLCKVNVSMTGQLQHRSGIYQGNNCNKSHIRVRSLGCLP